MYLTMHKKCPYSEFFWSIFFPYFPAFGLNRDQNNSEYGHFCISPYSVRMRENAGKIRNRITPNTDTFYTVKCKCNTENITMKTMRYFFQNRSTKSQYISEI